MNRRVWAAVVLLACVTACTNSAGAPAHAATSAGGATSAPNRATALSTAGGSSAAMLQPTSSLSVPAPNDMVGGFGSLWVVEHHDSALLRINPATVKPVARIAMPSKPGAVVVALGKIWVEDAAGMTEVDPATSAVIRTVPFASPCGTPAVLAHAIWLSNCGTGQLTEIDMGGKVLRRVPAGDYQIKTVLTRQECVGSHLHPGEVLLIEGAKYRFVANNTAIDPFYGSSQSKV